MAQDRLLSLDQLSLVETSWDVIVIGAGPAGGIAALGLAKKGLRTLLIDAKHFPRSKVCGCCLNDRAWQVLSDCGLAKAIEQKGAVRLTELRVACGTRRGDWPLDTMWTVSRSVMDQTIVQRACDLGVRFLDRTTAYVEPEIVDGNRAVRLVTTDAIELRLQSKMVVVASGLTSASVSAIHDLSSIVDKHARIGVGSSFQDSTPEYRPGLLTMAVGKSGYVGITRLENGVLNIAAAVDQIALKVSPSIVHLVEAIIAECQLPIPDSLHLAKWSGTPALTRSRTNVGAERLLVIGDAAGYVEPFTGEGMAWAMESGMHISPLVVAGCQAWSDSIVKQWETILKFQIRKSQWICRGLAQLLRYPRLAGMTLRWTKSVPWGTRWIIQRVTGPS